jgi:hypothetical protein
MGVDEDVKRKLDAVVGDHYDPPRDLRATLLKWLGAAVLAIAAAGLVMGILDKYLTKAQTAPAPPRPVTVQIIPAK